MLSLKRASRTQSNAEEGNMMVLGLGLWLLVVVFLLILSAASAFYTERRDLLAEADAISLALADDLNSVAYYSASPDYHADEALLASTSVKLARPGTCVEYVARTDDGAVEVRLSRDVDVPVVATFAPDSVIRLTAQSRAELRPR